MYILVIMLYSIIVFTISNLYIFNIGLNCSISFIFSMCIFILINFFPTLLCKKLNSKKLEQCRKGYFLLEIFVFSISYTFVFLFIQIFHFKLSYNLILINLLFVYIFEFIVFWNGIIRVYIYSKQLGIKYRVIGLALGMVPVANIFALIKIINITKKEVDFENKKILLNEKRKFEKICSTKYPILLVHGVFFRDFKLFDYWGRIPKELERNGAEIYYGNHSSALSIEKSAEELALRIKEIVNKTGCKKVNIIAHSKGGLDSRYAISVLKMDKYVASLTMINTPNRGCEFADYLLEKVSKNVLNNISKSYNSAAKKLGDREPDFESAVKNLTSSYCNEFNKIVPNSDSVYYKSVGSKLIKATNGRFPLNLTNRFVKYFDGCNDGLVGEKSFKYSEDYVFLEPRCNRGISHGDIIDLNRENIDGFDVREFYVQLVREIKEKGY